MRFLYLTALLLLSFSAQAVKVVITIDQDVNLNMIALRGTGTCRLTPLGLNGAICYSVGSTPNIGKITIEGDLNADITIQADQFIASGITATPILYYPDSNNEHPGVDTLTTRLRGSKGFIQLDIGLEISITDRTAVQSTSNIPIVITSDYL